MEIYNSTNFIANSLVFPPHKSVARMDAYKQNMGYYKGKYNIAKRLSIKTVSGSKMIDWGVPRYNFFKIITDKTVGLILNEKPSITGYDENLTKTLNTLVDNSGFYIAMQDMLRSFSTLGDGVLYVYNSVDGARLNAVNPEFYYKVVDSGNIHKVICHVFAETIVEENFIDIIIDDRVTHLRVLEHYKGYYIEKVYTYDGANIHREVEYKLANGEVIPIGGRKVSTGLKGFAVFPFHNSKAIDEVYGISDYKIFEDAVHLLEKKVAIYDAITDKHSDPMLQVDQRYFQENNETGEMEFKGTGSVVGARSGDAESKYVTWDGNLSELLDFIKFNIDSIATLSEFGKVFLTGEFASGNISGETIKSMAKSVLDKASRHIDTIDYTLRCVLCAMLELEGVDVSPSDISIGWQDGVSDSDLIVAQAIATRVGSGTMSRKNAMMKYDSITLEQAEQELEQMKKEGVDVIGQVAGVIGAEKV